MTAAQIVPLTPEGIADFMLTAPTDAEMAVLYDRLAAQVGPADAAVVLNDSLLAS